MTAIALAKLLSTTAFRYSDERGLQEGIERLFVTNAVPYEREVILSPKDRIDFMSGTTGIEVKVDSSVTTVQRQLARYAEDPRIEALILVTSKSKHFAIPRVLLEKPVLIVPLFLSIF